MTASGVISITSSRSQSAGTIAMTIASSCAGHAMPLKALSRAVTPLRPIGRVDVAGNTQGARERRKRTGIGLLLAGALLDHGNSMEK